MSGYLEVKYPLKANIGLNPFKSWRRQWCILRPSATHSGGSLAVYCSEAGSAVGSVQLPSGCVVRRAKSRSRPFAFAVFSAEDPRKPLVHLATQSLQDSHAWMEKIRSFLDGDNRLGTETESYSVTVVPTALSRQCGVTDSAVSAAVEGTVSTTSAGLRVSAGLLRSALVPWKNVADAELVTDADKNKICLVNVDSKFEHGGGELRLLSPLLAEVAAAVLRRAGRSQLSRSDPDLRQTDDDDADSEEVRRSSWYSGPSEVSLLDDIELFMTKESKLFVDDEPEPLSDAGYERLTGQARGKEELTGEAGLTENEGLTGGAGLTAKEVLAGYERLAGCTTAAASTFNDSMCDRRSLASVASGIYEEIAEDSIYCEMARSEEGERSVLVSEPAYESVVEAYCTLGRGGKRPPPPPLPPRIAFGGSKLGESWNSRMNSGTEYATNVTRHFSLGSIPRCCSSSAAGASSVGSADSASSAGSAGLPDRVGGPGSSNTLPTKARQKQPFSVFRKRLKSDSRLLSSPKSDLLKENKDVDTKKKKFDFAPTRDIFKNFKVSKKMKNLKITTGLLSKGETKSCEFLDETEHVSTNRCSKSVECLDDEFDGDLSIEFNDDAVAALALPQEIVDLILRSREQIDKFRIKENQVECDYMPMSPIIPPTPCSIGVGGKAGDIGHYIVMAPKTNLA